MFEMRFNGQTNAKTAQLFIFCARMGTREHDKRGSGDGIYF
jgi:hypothetical protein